MADFSSSGLGETKDLGACVEQLTDAIPESVLGMYRQGRSAAGVSAQPFRRQTVKVGRNDPCPCGSGKKYKKCCGAAANLH